MKRIISFLIFVVVMGVSIYYSPYVVARNRLVNVDFETGDISGWASWAVTTDVSRAANHTSGGEYSANPSLNEKNGPFDCGALIQEFEDIEPGSKIDASCWIKTENLKGPNGSKVYAILKIEYWAGDKIIAADEAGKLTGTNDWTKAAISTTVPRGTTMVKYLLMLWNDGGVGNEGEAYFDDVSMTVSSH